MYVHTLIHTYKIFFHRSLLIRLGKLKPELKHYVTTHLIIVSSCNLNEI